MKKYLASLAIALLSAGGLVVGVAVWMAPTPPPTVNRVLILNDADSVVATNAKLDKLPMYDTLEEAGVAGALRAYQCSHYYECGAPIAQRPDGKFVVGPMLSSRAGDHTEMSHAVPKGWKLVADIHDHPCLADTHYTDFFSSQDLTGGYESKIVVFMGDQCTGKVHEFDYTKDSPNDTKVEEDTYLTHGRIIGSFPVDGKSAEPKVGL